MEWMVPVNDMLKDEITKLNYTLIPPGCHGDVRSVRIVQESLGKLIDRLGEQSAAAQGLSKAITTAEKLRNTPTYVLYILKDAAGKNGDGEVVGFLKVATKHLYLYDERDRVCQVEPLCVLDFYVCGERQRRGYGKMLFDYMLQDTGSRPQELAIDGPSAKMETFLAKNYGVDRLIRQSNNFAVSPAFFATSDTTKSGRSTPVAPSAAVGRFTARKPPSSISDNYGVDLLIGQRNNFAVPPVFTATSETTKSGRSTPVAPSAAVGRFTARKPPSSISDVIHGTSERVYVKTNNGGALRSTPEEAPQLAPSPAAPDAAPAAPEAASVPEAAPELVEEPSPSLERPSSLAVAAVSPAGCATPRRDSQLTEQGYFDVKFYHNKLW